MIKSFMQGTEVITEESVSNWPQPLSGRHQFSAMTFVSGLCSGYCARLFFTGSLQSLLTMALVSFTFTIQILMSTLGKKLGATVVLVFLSEWTWIVLQVSFTYALLAKLCATLGDTDIVMSWLMASAFSVLFGYGLGIATWLKMIKTGLGRDVDRFRQLKQWQFGRARLGLNLEPADIPADILPLVAEHALRASAARRGE